MSAIPFDTLKSAKKMESAGSTPEQACGISAALTESLAGSGLATKGDLKVAVADLKVGIVRWLTITQLAPGGFIFAALKLVK